jgi:hypothetical protein
VQSLILGERGETMLHIFFPLIGRHWPPGSDRFKFAQARSTNATIAAARVPSSMDRSAAEPQPAPLKGDCKNCIALCCVALAFDRGPSFAANKAAGEACPQLSESDRCRLHTTRAERGFAGCVRYDCGGAGQATTALLPDHHWRQGGDVARELFDAFRMQRDVHELLGLLRTAESLPLTHEQVSQLRDLFALLDPSSGWTQATLTRFDVGNARDRVYAFLRGLAPIFVHRPRRLPLLRR